jgi:exopolysaccharide biosynthesis polyprenyl glycosylphosphotransferase
MSFSVGTGSGPIPLPGAPEPPDPERLSIDLTDPDPAAPPAVDAVAGRAAGQGVPSARTGPARRQWNRHRRDVVLADLLVAAAASGVAILLRFNGGAPGQWRLVPLGLPLVWVAIVSIHRTYERRYLASGMFELGRVMRSGLVLFAVIAVCSYLFRSSVSRSIVVFSVPVTVAGSLAVRQLFRLRMHHRWAAGHGLERTIVVGSGGAAVHLVELLQRHPKRGMLPVGVCLPPLSVIPSELAGVPVLGGPDDVLRAVDETEADVVAVVSDPNLSGHPLRRLAWALEERDVELVVSPGITAVAGPRLSIRPVAGLSLLHLEPPAMSLGNLRLKAVFDRTLGTLVLLVLSPFLLAIAAVVRATSPGPALFRQVRVGVDGREFTMYKFRSMVVDAEQRLIDLTHADQGNGVLFKVRVDPRVTTVGARLRRYSLDELPQLINVFKGEMSLVGPRPPLPREVATYTEDAVRRLRMRPGMTGLWQVSGRSNLTWEESLRHDLDYIDNWTMTLDLHILWRTVGAMLHGTGAY